MKRETKIGLLAIVTLVVIFLGYRFLSGAGVFSSQTSYRVVYENVAGLGTGDAVRINGYRVGLVTNVMLNPDNVRSLIVTFGVEEDLPIPKTASALIQSDGILGGKFISLEFERACAGADCAADGDYLAAAEQTALGALLGEPEDIAPYFDALRDNVGPVIDSVTARTDTNGVGRTLRNFERTSENLAALTYKIDRLLARSDESINATLASISAITQNLEANNARVSSILANVDSTTTRLAAVDLQGTLTGVDEALVNLRETLSSSSGAIDNLNAVTAKINDGDGTMAQLINDDELYERLNRTMANTDLLLQDFRLNPKRYVNVSVFGKRQREYEVPEDDPAEDQLPDPEAAGGASTGADGQ